MRKSKREKEKEREEAKRKEEEELAAKTYAEYLDTFEGTGVRHGGTASRGGGGFVKAGEGGTYDPARGMQPQKAGFAQAFDEDPTVSVSALSDSFMDWVMYTDTGRSVPYPHQQRQSRRASARWMRFYRKLRGAHFPFLARIILISEGWVLLRDQAEREERLARKSGGMRSLPHQYLDAVAY